MEYTEHAKLEAVKERSQEIGEFLEWLSEQGLILCRYIESRKSELCIDESGEKHVIIEPSGYFPASENTEKLLAKYFEIDLNRLEKEKREMLRVIQIKQEWGLC